MDLVNKILRIIFNKKESKNISNSQTIYRSNAIAQCICEECDGTGLIVVGGDTAFVTCKCLELNYDKMFRLQQIDNT